MKYVDRPIATERKDVETMYESVCKGITENTMIAWQIERKNDHSPCGQIGFYRNDKENHRGEVGYMIAPSCAGKGICSEALTAVLDYGFNEIKFHSIEGNVNPGNSTSIHILEKHGFLKEAFFKENFYFNGKFLDTAIYSLLASDWQKIREKRS